MIAPTLITTLWLLLAFLLSIPNDLGRTLTIWALIFGLAMSKPLIHGALSKLEANLPTKTWSDAVDDLIKENLRRRLRR